MVAVELAYLTVIESGLIDTHIILRSDNQGVVGALKNDSSQNHQQNAVLHCIISYTQAHGIWLTTKWISTNDNPADSPSRGSFPVTSTRFPFQAKIPFKLKPFISSPV
jgi:hypothetical protein